MKTATVTLVAGFTLLAGAVSASAEGLYVGGQLGISDGGGQNEALNDDFVEFGGGSVLSGFVGTNLNDRVRVEGELAYRQNGLDNVNGFPVAGDISSTVLMGNIFYDFGDGSGFTPYLGAGLGIAAVTMESGGSASGSGAAIQLMVGGSFPVGEGLTMAVDLRTFRSAPTLDDGAGGSFYQIYGITSLMVGLRRSF